MKTLKAIGPTLVLALSLSLPAYADTDPGDSHTPGRNNIRCDPATSTTPCLTGAAPVMAHDISLLTIADILWVLTSIY